MAPSSQLSCVPPADIFNCSLNKSPAKQHWSFAKSARFKKPKVNCDTFYDIPGFDKNKNRTTSFGYGRKTDLEYDRNPLHVVPPPTTYNIPSFSHINKFYKKGFTQLYSRQQVAPVSYVPVEAAKVPGPGAYPPHLYNDTPQWTLKSRATSQYFSSRANSMSPGPGQYPPAEVINGSGHYRLSNHRRSVCSSFQPSPRFPSSSRSQFGPNPFSYNPKNHLPSDGRYVLSQTPSMTHHKILPGDNRSTASFVEVSVRRSISNFSHYSAPGPGSYRAVSEFGYYDKEPQRQNESASNSQP